VLTKRHYRQCATATTHPDYATLVGPLSAGAERGLKKLKAISLG